MTSCSSSGSSSEMEELPPPPPKQSSRQVLVSLIKQVVEQVLIERGAKPPKSPQLLPFTRYKRCDTPMETLRREFTVGFPKLGLGALVTCPTNTLLSFRESFLEATEGFNKQIQAGTSDCISRMFGFMYGPIDVVMCLYMYNYTRIIKSLVVRDFKDFPDETASSVATVVAACQIICTQSQKCGVKDMHLLPNDTSKLLAFWGSPRVAKNAMWHMCERLTFYSPNGKETEIGGDPKIITNGRSLAYFEGPSGISCVVLTMTAGDRFTVDNSTSKERPDNPINYTKCNLDYHMVCFPCIALPADIAGSTKEVGKDTKAVQACKDLLAQLDIKWPGCVFLTANDLLSASVVVRSKHVSLVINESRHEQMPCHKGGYLTPSTMKQQDMVKVWFTEGHKMDLSADPPQVKNIIFSHSMKLLKETKDPEKVLNWTVSYVDAAGVQQNVVVSRNGVLLSSQFANWLFGRNGGYIIEDDKGRMAPAVLYDPPLFAKGAPLVMLCSGEWDINTAMHMLSDGAKGEVTQVTLRRLSMGMIQTFAVLKTCGLVNPKLFLSDYLIVPKDIQADMQSFEATDTYVINPNNNKHIAEASSLALFVRVCGAGIFTGPDCHLFTYLSVITNVLVNTGHGMHSVKLREPGGPRKRKRPPRTAPAAPRRNSRAEIVPKCSKLQVVGPEPHRPALDITAFAFQQPGPPPIGSEARISLLNNIQCS